MDADTVCFYNDVILINDDFSGIVGGAYWFDGGLIGFNGTKHVCLFDRIDGDELDQHRMSLYSWD